MMILAMDSAGAQVSCALGTSDGEVTAINTSGDKRHGETLAPAIQSLFRQAGAKIADVDLVAVDIGPGLFTGLRIGVSTANALAGATGAPMLGLSSLDLLARALPDLDRLPTVVVSVIDAKRGEVFWRSYRNGNGELSAVDHPQVSAPEEVARLLGLLGDDCLAVGDGAVRYSELFGQIPNVDVVAADICRPSALVILERARALGSVGDSAVGPGEQGGLRATDRATGVDAEMVQFARPGGIRPLYLRDADVRIGWAERPATALEVLP